MFRGLEPGNKGFLLLEAEAHRMLRRDPSSAEVVHPYLTGREILTGDGTPERWVIDYQRMHLLEAASFPAAFDHIKSKVLPQMRTIVDGIDRATLRDDQDLMVRMHKRHLVSRLDTWWQLRRSVPDTVAAISQLDRYIVCSRVTKRPIFVFLSSDIRPGDAVSVFGLSDDYSFGILQSDAHWQWFIAKCSKLTERFRYTPESVFNTFPWPQSPTIAQIKAVAETGREVRRVRADALKKIKGGLRAVYRTLELPGKNPLKEAHAALNVAVLDAYGFSAKKDLLAQLLELNILVAEHIKNGEPVTPPGVPRNHSNPDSLISDDCIRPRTGI
jgi:hypothetical protein